jgi:cobalt-zinc-cadmium efflux system outer membrane protein
MTETPHVPMRLPGHNHRRRRARWALALCIATLCPCAPGCSHAPDSADRGTVSAELYDRTGFELGDIGGRDDFSPLSGGEPLSEDGAVTLALLNNAAFQEQLADLGLSRADVIQAGLIANPDAQVLFPLGPKQLEATITAPIESLWLRGPRVRAARRLAEQKAAGLTQLALDLIRDVRLAYAELDLAKRRLALFEESSALRARVASIARARVRAGDALRLEEVGARVDAVRAEQEARSLAHGVTIAEERLRALLGAGRERATLRTAALPDAALVDWDVESLVAGAVAGRPDVRAAERGVTAARERAALARYDWLNVAVIGDANGEGSEGFEAGPGVKFTLPLFNQNQGNIARAEAEAERAARRHRTLVDRVILDVREAAVRYAQARDDLRAWRGRILPALAEVVELASRAYENGETPLVQALDTNRQLLDGRVREAQLVADLRRARAELERSVGRRLDVSPVSATGPAATRPGDPEQD